IFSRLSREDEKRLFFDSYNHELDFSGREKTYELDKWVFERVKQFLKRKKEDLKNETQVVYFLHLLGLDTAGHVHKPNTDLFLENLLYTDKGIKEMYELFEQTFNDNKTAYVLTSDHGMTDSGSHGAGDNFETETPFFIWGAGVKHKPYTANNGITNFYELEQAQMAPLMSALLGIATPMNNFGILPRDVINASDLYILYAAQGNAHQLYSQYNSLLQEHEKGLFTEFLPNFSVDNIIIDFKQYLETQNSYANEDQAIKASYNFMHNCLKGIDYYFSYYRTVLLIATTASILGWLGYLLKLLGDMRTFAKDSRKLLKNSFGSKLKLRILFVLSAFTLGFCLLQKLSGTITLYLLLPFAVWYLFLSHPGIVLLTDVKFGLSKFHLLVLLLCAELLIKYTKTFFTKTLKFYTSFFLSLVLCVFPLLPISVGYSNNLLLYCGIFMTLARPLLVKNSVMLIDKIVVLITLVNAFICIYMHTYQLGIRFINQIISWGFLLYVLVSLVRPCNLTVKQRLEKFITLLSTLYALFCTSYEALFLLLLITELILSIDSSKSYENCVSPLVSSSKFQTLAYSFRLAFIILLYTFFSFFGTGNMASINSFDPNIIRCFLTTFSPFVIMFLLHFCLISFGLPKSRQIFICLLLICDVMGLNFLFLVKNQGSWLEIGSSISHFVIMQVTTLILLLFQNFIEKLTHQTLVTAKYPEVKGRRSF
ncbi:hypothetical protein DOY81_013832, partial [Sarcophaga bullata]